MAIVFVAAVALGAAGFWYLSRPVAPKPPPPLTGDARAYVRNLTLSDVQMQANESYLSQQVVEITGKVGNTGNRVLRTVEINCVFYDPYGQVVLRERVSIVSQENGKPRPRRDQALPPGLRRYPRILESSHAATGHRRHRLLIVGQAAVPAALVGRRWGLH